MSATYRFAANVLARSGWTKDDALATAVQAVDAVTIVEHAEAGRPAPDVWTVVVDFVGQNDMEARETVRRALTGLRHASLAADAPSLVKGKGRQRQTIDLGGTR